MTFQQKHTPREGIRWTWRDAEIAAEIWEAMVGKLLNPTITDKSRALHAIATRLNRPHENVANRLMGCGPSFAGARTINPEATRKAEIDRKRRAEAMERRTITQAFFGDPPPGFSMLDRLHKRTVTESGLSAGNKLS